MGLGKLFLSLIGLMYLGPIGFILGLILGHKLDSYGIGTFTINNAFRATTEQLKHTQRTFFNITFEVMGHVAKSDGRVTATEIQAARNTMLQMQLNENQIKLAIAHFTTGKSKNFSLHDALNRLIRDCKNNRSLLQTFVEIQFQVAKANGIISPSKTTILQTICYRLGFAPTFSWEYDEVFNQKRNYRKQHYSSIDKAYITLSLSHEATPFEIKKKYRKLMNENHPDKLIAKGLPEEMIEIATDKTQKIKLAYDRIKEYKGF